MDEEKERGAVEVIIPDELVGKRLEAIATIARVCEKLATALSSPIQIVTINGNITANAKYGVKAKKR